MHRETKYTFCKCVEIEIIIFRTLQLSAATLQINAGISPDETNFLSMIHLECMEMAIAIPEASIPNDAALSAFTFCRWFLYDAQKPEWILEMENSKVDHNKDVMRTYIFSKLHLLDTILQAGNLNDTVYVDQYYFTAEDFSVKQYTYSMLIRDSDSMVLLMDKYQQSWPDAVLVGIGHTCCQRREEIKNDDKNNMIIEEMSKDHGLFVRSIINKNSKVY